MKHFIIISVCFSLWLNAVAQISEREVIPLDSIMQSTVVFTFGQSNSANFGQASHLYECVYPVYNYFEGNLYKAKDPLLGANGNGTCVWTILGDKMVESNFAHSVTFIPLGIGGVEIAQWAPGGEHHQLLLNTLDSLVSQNVKIDYVCWHQGESDNIANTSKDAYIQRFLGIREAFKSRGILAPFIIAVASYHPYCLDEDFGCSKEIREAQKELAKRYSDIFLGPDTDKLNKLYQRHDGIHFSYLGQREHAELWLKALRKARN